MKRTTRRLRLFASVVALVFAVAPASAATLHVANDGVDDPACGPSSSPCRSIQRGIDNAAEGDTIVVHPGRYSPDDERGCGGDCVVEIDKGVHVRSSEGAEVTLIDTGFGGVPTAVVISAAGAGFGAPDRGFVIRRGDVAGVEVTDTASNVSLTSIMVFDARNGFDLSGSGHTVDQCWAGLSVENGFLVRSDSTTIEDSTSSYNTLRGMVISSSDVTVKRVLLEGSGEGLATAAGTENIELEKVAATNNAQTGFVLAGDDHTIEACIASGNGADGIELYGAGHEVRLSESVGNGTFGIDVLATDVTLFRNNVFGNDAAGSNCGIKNDSGAPLAATRHFFGLAGGPGAAEPRDDVCGGDPIDTSLPASGSYGQPTAWLPGSLPSWP